MIRRPPRSTRTDTLFPYTTLFRSFAATEGGMIPGLSAVSAPIFDSQGTLCLVLTLVSKMRACHRSEEHTSELQSLMRISYAVFCLKKKRKAKQIYTHHLSTTCHLTDT